MARQTAGPSQACTYPPPSCNAVSFFLRMAGAIMVSKDSWAALQIGPTMPVAWVDNFGPNDAIGFEL